MNTRFSLKTVKMFFAMLALVTLASFALTMAAQAKTAPPTVPVPVLCTKNCLRVTDIALTKDNDTDPSYVTAVVTVKQIPAIGSNGAVAGVTVVARWTLPDGSSMKASGVTNQQGQIVFTTKETSVGMYTFTILTVQKDKFTFDRWNSVLTKSIR